MLDAFPFWGQRVQKWGVLLRLNAGEAVAPSMAALAWVSVLFPPALLSIVLGALIGLLGISPTIPIYLFVVFLAATLSGGLIYGSMSLLGSRQATLVTDALATLGASALVGIWIVAP